MNKKTKLITAIIILAIGLTACGGGATETTSQEVSQVQATSVAPVEEPAASVETTPNDVAVSAPADNTTYEVSTVESTLGWKGDKVVGDAHYGSINILEGSLVVEGGALVSGSVVIDMTSITNENLSGNDVERLVTHLKSDDFFSVDSYPTATIDIVSATSLGNGSYAVVGNLTIKGISNPIEFVAQATEENSRFTITSELVFDRTLYDVTYKSGSIFSSLGDKAINDEVGITVSIVASNTSIASVGSTVSTPNNAVADAPSSPAAGGQPSNNGGQTNDQQGQRPRLDFADAAAKLGVTEEALKTAFGEPGQGKPDFALVAAELGVTEQALIDALGVPAGGPPKNNG